MDVFTPYVIKSFKHDGHLHRMWLSNWRVPVAMLHPDHQRESMMVFINSQTKIQEADGKEWVSRIPGVSFFIPQKWFNIVALIEENGIRYYCNVASPLYVTEQVLTYIDYDLDVIRMPDGSIHVVDEEEYERHKINYHYSPLVEEKVQEGLAAVLQLLHAGNPPFQDDLVLYYYEQWEKQKNGGA
ncbi:DUF402 domain-containing protein [Paenibacillus sedimenti]|uniref:DUF402 domain-containing protein n=1 Tax=Paenibacillus sedimenti TaxID=2770274 RepID=A0A926QL05_9BACL|nr:DUF402 domain-containing protein [Paenibacillus sedimenti]MBD0382348.1 DUF402 domain-containing protein [Paenibacillus sedimenti]